MIKTKQPTHTVTIRGGDDLPVSLYRAKQVRELDRLAIQTYGIPGFTLMRRAGRAAFELMRECWPECGLPVEHGSSSITVVCGTGNNAGDGYVMAVLAKQQGLAVSIIQVGDAQKIQGDALQARKLALQDGVPISSFSPSSAIADGVIVDALLGTGLSGDVRGEYVDAINWVNEAGLPVLSVDIPSGLCSDTGHVLGVAVNADATISFIGLKQGLLSGDGPNVTGDVYFDDLAVPPQTFDHIVPSSERLLLSAAQAALPQRLAAAHKGHSGHVMVIGGAQGMGGAVIMASEAAARTGAGLVSCATHDDHIAPLLARCPEVMSVGISSAEGLAPLLKRPSVLVIGPGLGRSAWAEQLLEKAYQSHLPMVVDADALNLISEGCGIAAPFRDNWILTPHPAEAARLLGCSTQEVQRDRFDAVKELQARFGGAVILKGAGSLVACADRPISLCSYGNPGMAVGGMGDVLSGILGGLLAQGLNVAEAARVGVCLHAYAGDIAAQQGMCGMMATDLFPALRRLVNGGH